MDWVHVEDRWHEITGKVQARWDKLTDDEISTVAGEKDLLIRKIQTRYGLRREQAEHEVDDWVHKLDLPLLTATPTADKDR